MNKTLSLYLSATVSLFLDEATSQCVWEIGITHGAVIEKVLAKHRSPNVAVASPTK